MAQGRMIARKISMNKDLPRLIANLDAKLGAPHGAMAALLYTWSIAHLDVEGRMNGDPNVVKGNIVPRISFITAEFVEVYLVAMAEVGLVVYYEADGDRWLQFPGFASVQVGLRKDRESASRAPRPEAGIIIAGVTPAASRTDAGSGPAEEKGREEKEKLNQSACVRVDGSRLVKAWTDVGLPGLPAVTPLVEALNALPDSQVPAGDLSERFCVATVTYRAAYLEHKHVQIPADPLRLVDPKHFGNIVEVMLGRFDLSKLANGSGANGHARASPPEERPRPKLYEKKYADDIDDKKGA